MGSGQHAPLHLLHPPCLRRAMACLSVPTSFESIVGHDGTIIKPIDGHGLSLGKDSLIDFVTMFGGQVPLDINTGATEFMFGAVPVSISWPLLRPRPVPSPPLLCTRAENQSKDRISDFEVKTMDLDTLWTRCAIRELLLTTPPPPLPPLPPLKPSSSPPPVSPSNPSESTAKVRVQQIPTPMPPSIPLSPSPNPGHAA